LEGNLDQLNSTGGNKMPKYTLDDLRTRIIQNVVKTWAPELDGNVNRVHYGEPQTVKLSEGREVRCDFATNDSVYYFVPARSAWIPEPGAIELDRAFRITRRFGTRPNDFSQDEVQVREVKVNWELESIASQILIEMGKVVF
jgi:hypothetical protein